MAEKESTEQAIEKISNDVEQAIKECGVAAIRDLPKFKQAISLAKGMRELRRAVDETFVKHCLMPLMGTTLGFLADRPNPKESEPYGPLVVRDCAIEAMIRGFNVVGNEFNIIAGRFYGTKNGYARLVQEFPGLTDLVLQPGVPTLAGDRGALVPFTATWRLHGKPMSIECQLVKDGADTRIPVKVNGGMGPDAILGKAERKMLFRIYQRVNGSSYGATDGEVGDEQAFVTTGEPAPSPVPAAAVEGRRYSLKGKRESAQKQSTAPDNAVADTGAAAQATKASIPPPSATAPAAAPESLVDRTKLLQMLAEVDSAWDDPDMDAHSTIEAWSEAERASALRWVAAVLGDGDFAIQSKRPAHTLLGREPGSDG
jgi:hypothetical protein